MSHLSKQLSIIPIFLSIYTFSIAQSIPYVEFSKKSTFLRQLSSDSTKILKNVVSVHPSYLIDGTVAMGYERVIRDNKASLRGVIGFASSKTAPFYDSQISNFRQSFVEISYRYFLSRVKKTAPVGLYASVFAQYRQCYFDYSYVTYPNPGYAPPLNGTIIDHKAFSYAAGVMLGYQVIFLEMLTFDLFFGIGKQVTEGTEINAGNVSYYPLSNGFFYQNAPLFKFGASLGLNF